MLKTDIYMCLRKEKTLFVSNGVCHVGLKRTSGIVLSHSLPRRLCTCAIFVLLPLETKTLPRPLVKAQSGKHLGSK